MAIMKEKTGKGVAGDKIKEKTINQSRPLALSTAKLIPHALLVRKKTVSKRVDTRNFPSC